ncbi:MAG: hypothetical protein U0670_18615 [Anaerolineae bacterium]
MIPERIAAGGSITIDAGPDHWRLIHTDDGTEHILLETGPGKSIRYTTAFGSSRRLPSSNTLPADTVEQVVVGWTSRDQAWHLGFVLSPTIALERGSRWCELAHWADAQADRWGETAAQTGQALAAQINRPFKRVDAPPSVTPPAPLTTEPPTAVSDTSPVRTVTGDTSPITPRPPLGELVNASTPPAPPPPLPALPIKLDEWTLVQIAPAQLELRRSSAWGRGRVLRALWYLVLAVVFLVLSIGSLMGGIALPRMSGIHLEVSNRVLLDIPAPPSITLVIAGFFCAGLLVILALVSLFKAMTGLRKISIDGEMQLVRGMRGRTPIWSLPSAEIASVYASVVVEPISSRRRPESRKVEYGELNLLLKERLFEFITQVHRFEDRIPVDANANNEDSVQPLTAYNAVTPLHAVALYIARALDLPAMIDQRVRS